MARPSEPALIVALGLALACAAAPAVAMQAAPTTLAADADAVGLPVLSVEVVGNERAGDTLVLNAARTAVGEAFDPETVAEDYQRIYALRRFRRVEARYEVVRADDGTRGVAVVFEVEELPTVAAVRFEGNRRVDDATLRRLIDAEAGLAAGARGDPVLLAFAADAIERYYESKSHALAEVRAERDEGTGAAVFRITEGPRVFVRNVDFLGADSFTEGELKKQVRTRPRGPLGFFGDGRLDERQIEEDVQSLRRFYRQEKGFFDARVGRRLVWSPDLSEVQVEFLVDEGPRYRIGEIEFEGVEALDEAALRARLAEEARLAEGTPYDGERVRAAVAEIVEAYSPLGYIYSPPPPGIAADPQYLNVRVDEAFRLEPGVVDLTVRVGEGRPFRVGEVRVRGNTKTQDKVILRQFDTAPGELYDSDDVQRATRRLQAGGYYSQVRVTPVLPPGQDADSDTRDILVEVEEQSTAVLTFGGSVSSNGGLFGTISYEQKNFDLFDLPEGLGDTFGGAFQGAGQTFLVRLQPGTVRTNASVAFYEPYLLDQNLGFGTDAYYRTVRRREYRDTRGGGRVRLIPRLGRNLSTTFSLRGEDVRIFDLDAPLRDRAPDIREFEGHTTLTSAGFAVGYTDVDSPLNTTLGYAVDAGWESFGVLGGPSFQRVTASVNGFVPLYRDLGDRAVVLEGRGDAGAIYNDAPFFERFYEGGFGSVRGFRYRGISPRGGIDDDPVGGDFTFTASTAVSFPLYEETLRGVAFVDAGSVDDDTSLTTIRVAAGFGFRLTLGPLGGVPIALDFAWPINKRPEDDEQVFSFSLGILQ